MYLYFIRSFTFANSYQFSSVEPRLHFLLFNLSVFLFSVNLIVFFEIIRARIHFEKQKYLRHSVLEIFSSFSTGFYSINLRVSL